MALRRDELTAVVSHWVTEILDLKATEEIIGVYSGSTEGRIAFWKDRIKYVESYGRGP